ncbi:hypothetical protein CAPTEDRAFT_190830 [Capitella teleta]|uniref:Rhodanese domain-containing protein n=1 Tax=Capitella teleta TaxID=283909 RepID=R7TXY7_CAPTE|nr:hypothetical protein CAPTEDRAFT_190830 [Capitella teleta]|eukprot:ELT98614.1 hypothetical protein CAPTEDRAFT_190830 [Capitella teleta]
MTNCSGYVKWPLVDGKLPDFQQTLAFIGEIENKWRFIKGGNNQLTRVYSRIHHKSVQQTPLNLISLQKTMPSEVQTDDRFAMRFVINSLKKKWANVSNVSTETLNQWMNQEVSEGQKKRALTIIDARPEEEYAVSHIAGATRVDFRSSEVCEFISKMDEQNKAGEVPTVVCYCSLGYRSCKFADTLKNALQNPSSCGIEKTPPAEIYNLEGSIFKWANENRGNMVDGKDRPTKFVHPFSPIWGKVLFSHLRRDKMEP